MSQETSYLTTDKAGNEMIWPYEPSRDYIDESKPQSEWGIEKRDVNDLSGYDLEQLELGVPVEVLIGNCWTSDIEPAYLPKGSIKQLTGVTFEPCWETEPIKLIVETV